jgi:hypothetical protein
MSSSERNGDATEAVVKLVIGTIMFPVRVIFWMTFALAKVLSHME